MITVFRNGSIFDGHHHRPGTALVVADGRITRLVGEDEVGDQRADEVVDLAGGLVAPGFVDAHVHTVQGGLERIRCDLTEARTREDALAAIAAYAAANPAVPWILGGGWSMPAFPGGAPTAADLDNVVPDRPVFLPNRDHHGAWVNTRALEVAGVGAATPDPRDGRVERDARGRPTGTLHEGAMALVGAFVPPTDPDESYRALLAGQAYLHRFGVTGWQDAILGSYAGMDDPSQTYLRAARRGDLTGHVVGALWWDRDRGEEQVADLLARRTELTHGRLHATSVKIMQDGVAENGTAAMTGPYLDRCGHANGNRGHSFIAAEDLCRHVSRLHREGFQVHVHAIGDRAVREALDAFELAARSTSEAGHPDPRHHIAHLQFVHPDDVPRFAALGVTATAQMLWACLNDQMVDLTLPFLDEERARWQYPFGALDRAGTHLAAGSDWPVSTPDPLAAIHVAVNRWGHAASGRAREEAFLPEQALTLARAFAAYTSGSARINHRDDAGSLWPGAVADLVVLDSDPFRGPPEEIGATRARSTWIDGRMVQTQE